MCYSGKCLWENHMGDCSFPDYILKDWNIRCNCTMNDYMNTKNEIIRLQKYRERNHKIKKIKEKCPKNGLLDNSL